MSEVRSSHAIQEIWKEGLAKAKKLEEKFKEEIRAKGVSFIFQFKCWKC